jgi:hypothetical protein
MPSGVYKRSEEEFLRLRAFSKKFGFQKGHKPTKGTLGYHHTAEVKEKIAENARNAPHIMGRIKDKNGFWKGETARYVAKHNWVQYHKGKAMRCENKGCHYPRTNTRGGVILAPSKFEWANVDHKYRRVLEDYISLCHYCHYEYDKQRR